MIRLFKQHYVRKQEELEGLWDFMPVDDKKMFPAEYKYKMMVPSCWESDVRFAKYRGYAAYRTKFKKETAGHLRITFKGVSHTADVYLDGKHVKNHYNAYTSFSVIVPNVSAGVHELIVMADNTFSDESVLHKQNDYYTYGGLIRPVVLEEISDVYIKSLHFTPVKNKEGWIGKFTLEVENLTNKKQSIDIDILLDGKSVFDSTQMKDIVISPNVLLEIETSPKLRNITQWSCDNPKLYDIRAMIKNEKGKDIDDLCDRVGFRTISVKGNKLLLNDEEIFIKGFNRHEDYGFSGCSISPNLAYSDLSIIEDLGANSVRTCHYPNDERFLDMCDEKGIIVWEENHVRGMSLERMQHPNFEKQCEDCIREMIDEHYNHPSIIIWGILNECASETEEGRKMYAKQFEQIKSMDSSRPLTFATCRYYKDLCLDLVDIVSYNIYSSWYDKLDILETFTKLYDWIQTAGGKGKPIIISEFGAGAIAGYHDRFRGKWTEERQADILDKQLSVYLDRDEIAGTYIWQFCDCRVTEDYELRRPGGYNNKGIVGNNRQPKLSYEVVKKHYNNHE